MDNELITEKSRWKNWKRFLPLCAIVLIGMGVFSVISDVNTVKKERENGIAFDEAKWKAKKESDYPYRNQMLKDLMKSGRLRPLKKEEIIGLLGQPDRSDNAYLFYKVSQERIGLFPLHTTTLVIVISNDGTGNKVLIHQ